MKTFPTNGNRRYRSRNLSFTCAVRVKLDRPTLFAAHGTLKMSDKIKIIADYEGGDLRKVSAAGPKIKSSSRIV